VTFRQLGCRVIGGIAEIDAATQGAPLARRAAPERVLPGAGLALIQRALRGRSFAKQELDLGSRNEQDVTELAESTATSTELTGRPELGNLGIEVGIQGTELRGSAGLADRVFRQWRRDFTGHFGSFVRVDWISASV